MGDDGNDSYVKNNEFLHKSDIVFPDFLIWLNAPLDWVKERAAKSDLSEE